MLSADVRQQDGVFIVAVTGEVDSHNARLMRAALASALGDSTPRVIADLSAVTFMDSSGLGVLVGKLKDTRMRGGALHLVVTEPRVLQVFAITGLDAVFHIHDALDAALAAIGGESPQV